jgi:D-serine deaminase-like pyridoxal phosphate-dependent protein
LKPSEEHLPIEVAAGEVPAIGELLYLIPRHVCPTVNNFDDAVIVEGGRAVSIERVTARGHEAPLSTYGDAVGTLVR